MYNIKIKPEISTCHKTLLIIICDKLISHTWFLNYAWLYTEILLQTHNATKSELYRVCLKHSHPNCCNKVALCWAGGDLAPSDPYFWSSEEVSWWSKIPKKLQKCKKLSYKKLRILCWRCTFTSKSLWQMPEPSWWLCRNICHCSPFSWEKLLQIKSSWISKHILHILTFWKTIVQYHHRINNIKMYSFLLSPVTSFTLGFKYSLQLFFSQTPLTLCSSPSQKDQNSQS